MLLRLFRYLKRRKMLKKLNCSGKNIRIEQDYIVVGHSNISLGNNVYIGPRATIYTTGAQLIIGDHFIAGPGLTIITGDHRIDLIGHYIDEVTERNKLPENDQAVIIEDDVWCGANVTILKGVTIHKGAVVASGAVVTKDVCPYSIVGGVPAKTISYRFTPEQIEEHERIIERRTI